MSDPLQSFPRASALSPRLETLASTASTNADLLRAVAGDPGTWPDLSVILTTDQRAGRGRLDRVWTAPAGTALAASVVVDCTGIPMAVRGWVPLLAGAAMTRAVSEQLPGEGERVRLKWPNDVLVDGAKLCGILAEVVPGNPDVVVVGSGVNTAMTRDQLPVPTATSFAVLGVTCDVDALVASYLTHLRAQIGALRGADGNVEALVRDIESLCATLGRDLTVSLPDGTVLRGVGQRIETDGRLVVATGDREVAVSAGDVVHVR
ncbi:biotin--[acetyl-CoA-carboxylase] ligase [Microbacterium sp. C7(2022)]|uniref:biotin--[acetyl-CoA-carboxylase] ligase n=1 Tax=Microbacterium sp. C7(2022) TaxID=2992759 RepID=UPI00237B1279|nr:biotin--[acetyl-CoA-carboxylase] ligase [Microbacterium sp. C7(2022)]MDE0547333.1 biotin--[acetyl-CoA-carboxylase] ligase [Microbacterium sp. C7(2022)]